MAEKHKDDKEAENATFIVPSERRVYPRIALSIPVRFSVVKEGEEAKEEEHEGLIRKGQGNLEEKKGASSKTVNLSTGGLLMTTGEQIKSGSIVHLSMHLPLPGLSCNCSVLGKVLRSEGDEKKGYKTAVKFLKIVHHNLNKYKYAALKDLLNIEGPKIKLD